MSSGKDPLLQFQFSILIIGAGSMIYGYFTEISGMSAEQEVAEYKVYHPVTRHDDVKLIPGRRTPGEITLKQGVTDDIGMWGWRQMSVSAPQTLVRSMVTLTMYNRKGEPKAYWLLIGVIPTKISGPEFNAASSQFGVEELTMRYEAINRLPLPPFP